MYSYRVSKWVDLITVEFSKVSPLEKGVNKGVFMEVVIVASHEIGAEWEGKWNITEKF